MGFGQFKISKGIIKVHTRIIEGRIKQITISVFLRTLKICFGNSRRRLKGLPYEHNTILNKIEEFFINALVSAPTASP